jgi:hypothetical protein
MAAREEDKAMAGLLRRSLAQDAGTGSGADCPEPEILAGYFDRALDAPETARYDLHFSRCSVCRETLAAMARAGGADDAEKKTASAWNWLTGQRWMMPAAAALVALVVISGIALRMRKPLASPNQVAMSRPSALPETAPSPEPSVAPPPATEEFSARLVTPSQPGATGNTGADEASRAKSLARNATRRDELSAAGAGNEKSSANLDATAHALAQRNNSGMARGALRAGNASAAGASASVSSANQSVTVTEAAPVRDATEAPADVPAKQTETMSAQSEPSVVVREDEAKQSNAPKAKSPATASAAAPAPSAKAMNLAASRANESAAFAKLQQAQISSNLMNLQIQTPDPKVLWMIRSAGEVEKSEDGGTTWKPEYLDTRAAIVAGSAPTVKICWLVGGSATILRTTNGTHWKTISAPADTDFVRVDATDASTATVTAIDGRKFSTSDGGKSWSIVK